MSELSNADLLNIEQAIENSEAQDAFAESRIQALDKEQLINAMKYWRNHAKELVQSLKKMRGL